MQIEQEIIQIKERNSRVEMDKKWELSWTRRLFIAVVTYVVAGVWLVMIKDNMPWLKAFVPVAGYVFSTFTLPPLKKWWVGRRD